MNRTRFFAALLLLCGCGREPTGPQEPTVRLSIAEGDSQFGAPGEFLQLPLTVHVIDAARSEPADDIGVKWRIVAGTGATLEIVNATSDGLGLAAARVRLGPDTGVYRIEASASRMEGAAPVFIARAVRPPTVVDITPMTAVAGETITITGTRFRANAEENAVLFGGLRGRTLSATSTSLTVEVPRCVLTRQVDLRVAIGAVMSDARPVQTVAGPGTPVDLEPGEAQRITSDALDCVQFGTMPPGSRYLIVAQNAVRAFMVPLRYELLGIAGVALPVTLPPALTAPVHTDRATAFEHRLRTLEAGLGPVTPLPAPELQAMAVYRDPEIGDTREFNVLKSDNTTRRVTAEVRWISDRAILYVDRDAPANGLTTADLQHFGSLFDDPIYSTVVGVFGEPSDIDGNGRIIILFTPAVNALTDRNDSGFIAGYFFGCDLVAKTRCADTNSGEIFYSMVPDPEGKFSAPRSASVVLRTVPAVLAHEFQHMINFHRKGGRLDVLWLSEGLAHMAEDLVGMEFMERGDAQTAVDFQRPNLVRAQLWLGKTAITHFVSQASPGTLEQRGAAWLLVRYLVEHYGGPAMLGQLAASNATGAENIEATTGRSWEQLLAEFGVAVWAEGEPQLAGLQLDRHFTFGTFPLRARISMLQGGFPLNPPVTQARDFFLSATVASGGSSYLMLNAPTTAGEQLHLAFTSLRGGPFPSGSAAQLMLFRIR